MQPIDSSTVNAINFWNTDIPEFEKDFLKGRDISSLEINLDERVPAQGSIILDRPLNSKRTALEKIKDFFSHGS